MSVGSSIEWNETCDAIAASQFPPIETTVPPQQQQQQQQQPRILGLTYSEMMAVDRDSQ